MESLLFASSIAAAKFALYLNSKKAPSSEAFVSYTTQAGVATHWRMVQATVYQMIGTNPVCDNSADLKGQRILLTGGYGGIGLETAKGLVKRGANVTIVGRTEAKLMAAIDRIKEELHLKNSALQGSIRYTVADMSDLDAVRVLVKRLVIAGQKFDQLILNAGVWPQEYSRSRQGCEIAFATNALGPHMLLRALINSNLLRPEARVIAVTGDIYITVAGQGDKENCTPDFFYSTAQGCQDAYCRSKLGLMWLFDQMHQHYPALHMYLVHPGVVDSGLMGDNPLPKCILVSNEEGAQTTLICATADTKLLVSGGYYHNTLGRVELDASDPALNASKAEALWEVAENLIVPYL